MVPGEAEFRKHQEIQSFFLRPTDVVLTEREIGLQIPEARINLRDPYRDLRLHRCISPLCHHFHKSVKKTISPAYGSTAHTEVSVISLGTRRPAHAQYSETLETGKFGRTGFDP